MSRDEIDDSTAKRQHSDRVNQGAEHEHSNEHRDSLKLPVERSVKESRHTRDGANHRKRAKDETDDEKSTHVNSVSLLFSLLVVG
jgi:hypothetical protein